MIPSVREHERLSLTRIAAALARDVSEQAFFVIGKSVIDCFNVWKLSKARHDGTVDVPKFPGVGLLNTGEIVRLPIDDVPAWRCAGPLCLDYIGLAFELWLDGYGPFNMIIEGHGLAKVFAVIVLLERDDASPSSLIRANGLLCDLMSGELVLAYEEVVHWQQLCNGYAQAAHKARKGLKEGPTAAKKSRQALAVSRYAMLRERFGDLFQGTKPVLIKDAARRVEEATSDPADPLHGVYTYSTLRDDVLPRLKKDISAERFVQNHKRLSELTG